MDSPDPVDNPSDYIQRFVEEKIEQIVSAVIPSMSTMTDEAAPIIRRNILNDTPEEVAQEWLDKLDINDLEDKSFKFHWRIKVPLIFSPPLDCNCLSLSYDEDKAKAMLFEPLLRFLSGNEDPELFLQKLASKDPPAICGRVFKAGEATYSCRDCGTDPTCVLCVDCFKSSGHRNHRYKISTSGGGGYCDCGDGEAWKINVFCDIHEPGGRFADGSAQEDHNLPASVMNRAKLLFEVVLLYCYEMLTLELDCSPANLRLTPTDLSIMPELPNPDSFCSVLLNDEINTFDFVINTLTLAVGCSKKDAIDFAKMVDREGRSIVKCSNFQSCRAVMQTIIRETIQNGGKALRVFVMQSHVVAHQTFAMRLLAWMQELLTHSSGLRHIFCDIVKETLDVFKTSILEGIMLGDIRFWKAVRSLWHNLIITGFLKEYERKKEFAKIYIKNYADLMKAFIYDDHEHLFSITALSVQIFTVPTVAHFLIEEHDVISIIMKTVLTEYEMKLTPERKLELNRGTTNNVLQRATFAIMDLKYILTSLPTIWTEKLKRNFLSGIREFFLLLSYMQGMDPLTRQTGRHMEYEPEWESSFNLHLKLASVISLTLEWCGTDKDVLKGIYRECLTLLGSIYNFDTLETVKRVLANHSAICYEYDVSSQPVSLHLPLTRLLAGLHLHLEAFNLDFFSQDFDVTKKPCLELIIEPALQIQTLMSQAYAGMWKRNGYSLLNQLYLYHNVRCRSDMFDKDIIALQIGASLIESNKFLLHLLNRFDLFQWAEMDFDEKAPEDDTLKYIIVLMEEFFGLVITIVSARYTPGVAMVSRMDNIKKEIIQQLCIDSMTHSNLNKALVENVNYETGLETVIEELATLKKSTVASWTYELKPEFYEEYELYHYHYTREEQSKAEEKQRERKKAKGEKEIFPPPRLPPFSPAFGPVVNVLKSDVLLHLMTIVIQRGLKKSCSYSDSQLRKVLHLIGHGLNEEIAQRGDCFQFSECAKRCNLFILLEQVLKDASLSQHREMINWIRQQYNCIQPQDMVSSNTDSLDVNTQQTNDEEIKERKAKAEAAKKRYLEKMQQAQSSFVANNQELFVEENQTLSQSTSDQTSETIEVSNSVSIALGPNRSPSHSVPEKQICILCQEEGNVDNCENTENKLFVLATFIQRSTVQCQYRDKLLVECQNKSQNKLLHERDPLFLAPDLLTAPIVSCCGHVMHASCWERHYEGVVMKERRRPFRSRYPFSFDVDKGEYLCPLCDSICNTVLPLSSPSIVNYGTFPLTRGCSFDVFLNAMRLILENKTTRVDKTVLMKTGEESTPFVGADLTRLHILESFISSECLKKILKDNGGDFELLFPTVLNAGLDAQNLQTFLDLFLQMVYMTGLDVDSMSYQHFADYRQPIMVWQAVAFTISAMEAFHRDQNLIFFGDQVPQRKTLTLCYLVRGCAMVTQLFQRDNSSYVRSNFLKLMDTLLQNPFGSPSILEVDAFTLLVSLTFSISSLFCDDPLTDVDGQLVQVAVPNGNMRDFHLLRLVYMFHITQVLITGDFRCHVKVADVERNMETDGDDPESQPNFGKTTATRKVISEIWRRRGKSFNCDEDVDFKGVWKTVCESMIPFLRCCAKFYEHLASVPPSNSLEQDESTFDNLVAYLGLPNTVEDIFDSPSACQMAYKWASHPSVVKLLEETKAYTPIKHSVTPKSVPKMLVVKYPRLVNRLFPLPADYTELINSVSNFTCSNCGSHQSKAPTMCLICGMLLCSQSYCCQSELGQKSVGACTYHAYYCGGGNGIFLRIRECSVFFLGGGSKGCFMSPPYVDEYGETDQGLRRGNPMTLSREKYDVYRRIWLQHAIPEEIARVTEHSSALLTTDWQHL